MEPNLETLPDEDVISFIKKKKHKFQWLSFLRTIFLFLFIIISLVIYLNQHIQAMNVSYKLNALEKDLKLIQRQNELLQIELAKYVSMENIDDQAVNKLQMLRPNNIKFIKTNKERNSKP